MKILALIPARKGSKRIKNKNKKLFLGEPIILRTIKSLKSLNQLDTIYVSTDDDEISNLVERNNCKTTNRPEALCNDFATSTEVLTHFAKIINYDFDILVMVYPTTPRLNVKLLEECITKLQSSSKMHSGASVIRYPHPIERRIIKKDESYKFEITQNSKKRTQDTKAYYHDSANFYVFKKSFFIQGYSLFSSTTLGVELPREYYFDIDTEEDWDYAESIIKD